MKRAIAYALVGILLAGCSPKVVTVSGQVFVVTGGRENIKLGLVEVAAIPENDLTEHFKKKQDNRTEQQKLLMASLQAAEAKAKSATDYIKGMDPFYELQMRYNSISEKDLAKYREERNRLKADIVAYQDLKREFDHFDSPAYYVSGPHAKASVSKTDADGKFTVAIPSGKYVIVATTSRKVFKKTESYSWAVRIDASSPSQSIMLSNDNLVETKCKECVPLPTS